MLLIHLSTRCVGNTGWEFSYLMYVFKLINFNNLVNAMKYYILPTQKYVVFYSSI